MNTEIEKEILEIKKAVKEIAKMLNNLPGFCDREYKELVKIKNL